MRAVAHSRLLLAAALAIPALLVAAPLASTGAGSTTTPTTRAETSTTPAAPSSPRSARPVRYDRDIRPLLSDRCFLCHGPDPSTRRAGLRLDDADAATAELDGAFPIVPGDPDASELWRRISSDDPDERMPPRKSPKRPFTEAEQALVRQWIEEGAQYEPHWSFVPPARPSLPAVADNRWARNPIDRFVLARLEQDGITPAPEAERETLARRLHLDLTGLPPTPAELDAFLADTRPDAYERLVDTLLTAEPYRTRYAERMAAPWLDAARYADTCGIHMDAGRQSWLWRDWVIAAYRDNLPYDQFLLKQLAGDLLPQATDADRIATAFNRNHVTSDEGGAIVEELLVEYAVDRAATTSSVFLGLTMGCARCHDHKFDPISQSEFYSFYAYFNSIEEPGLYSQTPDAQRAHEPFLVVPTPAQAKERAELRSKIEATVAQMDAFTPEESASRTTFMNGTTERAGVRWATSSVVDAKSSGGATLTAQPDGSVLASGANPAQDEHVITLRTDGTELRLLLVEAIADPSIPSAAAGGKLGRAPNGNAVVSGVSAEAVSIADPTQRSAIRVVWAWADVEQDNGDFGVVNVLDGDPATGWAVDGHRREDGRRAALLLADRPFGFEGGTTLEVHLEYRSPYSEHSLGRVRLALGAIAESGVAMLPTASSAWHVAGPFPADPSKKLFDTAFGPEEGPTLDLRRNFGAGNQYWRVDPALRDGRLNTLAQGNNVTYVGRRIFAPTARTLDLSLGSDDGFRLFANGAEAGQRDVERGLRADQDRASVPLNAGENAVVLKVVNTGGDSGFFWRTRVAADEAPPALDSTEVLRGDLVAALIPPAARSSALEARLQRAWRHDFLPAERERRERLAGLERRAVELEAAAPRTIVMKELPTPRPTYVLDRGQYDRPDMARPVSRGVPAALGALPENATPDRLGLARWMIDERNPLVARVAANRLWELLFGAGLVRTSEDFGLQGEWPSHPELLDWLAVELRESGWDMQRLLRTIVGSATYRQSSRVRPELHELDPDNQLLAFYPRRRFSAEQIRDQALYVAGLLVERSGGPSVKPYQPEGLWQEVAMPGSNTRVYERGMGDELWRRGIYTYWKRAAPPPSLLTFDAPTREACTVRRAVTNTPLQALVLWNDEQYVEAARALAERELLEGASDPSSRSHSGKTRDEALASSDASAARTDDDARLSRMFRRVVGRAPDGREHSALAEALAAFRERYRAAPDDAAKLVAIGESPTTDAVDAPELAAWTMIASSLLNLHAAVTQQ